MEQRQTGRPVTIDPEEVSLVAVRLFDERGFDAVSMNDVAEAAGVSRRSLFRLFPTKSALVWGGLDEFIDRFEAALASTDASATANASLIDAYVRAAAFAPELVEVTRLRLRVIDANPGLANDGAARVAAMTRSVSSFIAERDGDDPDGLAVTVRANVIAAAGSAALTWWALHSEDEAPAAVLERALRLV
jgi:AcrR family transcriptional regulator